MTVKKCDKLDSIMLQIETNIRKAFSKCNGLEILLICKVVDIVRDTLSEEWKEDECQTTK